MNNFENLTIVSVTGHSDYTLGSMYAIQRSCMELSGAKGLLISPNRPDNLPPNIRHESCKPFGYIEYSIFTLYLLEQFITTDYCLIVQDDGWVFNGKNWRDDYWQYDYIGSAHPILYEHNQGNIHVHRADFWYENEQHPNPNLREFQNGGFSLRTKRMLSASRHFNLPMTILPPIPWNTDQKIDWQFEQKIHNEDIFLSGIHRPFLESQGLKFGSPSDSTLFSADNFWLNCVRNKPITQCLGGHLGSRAKIIGINQVQINNSKLAQLEIDNQLPSGYRLIELFEQLGYDIYFTE